MFESMLALIDAGDAGLDAVRRMAASAKAGQCDDAIEPVSAVKLLAPIPRPRKNVFCVGRNYVEHVNEGYRASGTAIGGGWRVARAGRPRRAGEADARGSEVIGICDEK